MGAIDIGSGAVSQASSIVTRITIDAANTANDTGTLDTIEVYFSTNSGHTDVGTFSRPSGDNFTPRDYEALGSVSAGSKQTFTGLDCDVETGDYLGLYAWGNICSAVSGGSGFYQRTGSAFPTAQAKYYLTANRTVSIYGTGATPTFAPTVTTQSATSISSSGFIGNGTITATGGVNVTRRGFCYKAGTSGDPTTADSVVYDDGSYGTGSFNKAISGLSAGTSYRVRAYAVNSIGTGYGTTVTVETLSITNVTLSIDVLSEATADGIAPVDITEGQGITLTIDALAEALAEGIIPSNITAGTGVTLSVDVLAEAAAAGIPCIFAGYWDLPHKLKLTASNNRTLVLKASNNRDLVLKAENNRTLVLKARD